MSPYNPRPTPHHRPALRIYACDHMCVVRKRELTQAAPASSCSRSGLGRPRKRQPEGQGKESTRILGCMGKGNGGHRLWGFPALAKTSTQHSKNHSCNASLTLEQPNKPSEISRKSPLSLSYRIIIHVGGGRQQYVIDLAPLM